MAGRPRRSIHISATQASSHGRINHLPVPLLSLPARHPTRVVYPYITAKGQEAADKFFRKSSQAAYRWTTSPRA